MSWSHDKNHRGPSGHSTSSSWADVFGAPMSNKDPCECPRCSWTESITMHSLRPTLQNSMDVPLTTKQNYHLVQQFHVWLYTLKNWKQRLEEICVHPCTWYYLQQPKVEATRVSIDGWLDKQNEVYTYNAILFSPKKEVNSATSYNMNVGEWRNFPLPF